MYRLTGFKIISTEKSTCFPLQNRYYILIRLFLLQHFQNRIDEKTDQYTIYKYFPASL